MKLEVLLLLRGCLRFVAGWQPDKAESDSDTNKPSNGLDDDADTPDVTTLPVAAIAVSTVLCREGSCSLRSAVRHGGLRQRLQSSSCFARYGRGI